MARIELGFGEQKVLCEVEDSRLIAVVEGKDYPPVADMKQAFMAAIEQPLCRCMTLLQAVIKWLLLLAILRDHGSIMNSFCPYYLIS